MKRPNLFGILVILFSLHAQSQSQLDLLNYWAPQVYQDMNSKEEWGRQFYTARDAIVEIDFDNDWNTLDNWDNSKYQVWEQGNLNDRETPPLAGAGYVSLVESGNFYFLYYGFYHAGDDSEYSADRHEHDWEGVIMVIKKDGSTYGSFEGMLTRKHSDLLFYNEGSISWTGSHPQIYISPNGSLTNVGFSAATGHGIEKFTGSGDQINYWNRGAIYSVGENGDNVTDVSTDTDGGNNPGNKWTTAKKYNYKLIPIYELWNHRRTSIFNGYTQFNGNESDGGVVPFEREYWYNPINYFKNDNNFNHLDGDLNGDNYLFNPFFDNHLLNDNGYDDSGVNNIYEVNPSPATWSQTIMGDASAKLYSYKGTHSLQVASSTLSGSSDDMLFVWQTLSGDGEISGKVYNVQDLGNDVKAGFMIRESLDEGSNFIFSRYKPNLTVGVISRTSTNSSSSGSKMLDVPDNRAVWLKLKKSGDSYTSYYAYDGVNWVEYDSRTIGMGNNTYVGMALSSIGTDQYADATFDDVFVTAAHGLTSAVDYSSYQSGTVMVDQDQDDQWTPVSFSQTMASKPIVVAGPVSYNGTNETTYRVRNVTTSGFEVKIDEWDYLDGAHGPEDISYLAVVAGSHNLAGLKIEAGSIAEVDEVWVTKSLSQSFSTTPVILATQVTDNGNDPTAVRLRNVGAGSFDIRLQEEEAKDDLHGLEEINYIAVSTGIGSFNGKRIEAGLTGLSVDERWYQVEFSTPFSGLGVIANIQTYEGGDPVALRYDKLLGTSVDFLVEEEQSENDEVGHNNEVVGWVRIENIKDLSGNARQSMTISKNADLQSVIIYPNPSKGRVIINAPHIVDLTVQDLNGRTVYQKDSIKGKTTLDLRSTLKGGIYFMRLADQKGNIRISKMIVQD